MVKELDSIMYPDGEAVYAQYSKSFSGHPESRHAVYV